MLFRSGWKDYSQILELIFSFFFKEAEQMMLPYYFYKVSQISVIYIVCFKPMTPCLYMLSASVS